MSCSECLYWASDGGTYGECTKHSQGGGSDPAFIEAQADDDQGLCACLKTRGDFGCVCFEDKSRYAECEACHRIVRVNALTWSTVDGAMGLCPACWAEENPDE